MTVTAVGSWEFTCSSCHPLQIHWRKAPGERPEWVSHVQRLADVARWQTARAASMWCHVRVLCRLYKPTLISFIVNCERDTRSPRSIVPETVILQSHNHALGTLRHITIEVIDEKSFDP